MANPESDQAFATFEQKWLVANPEQVMVGLFVAPSLRVRAVAFACLVHELSAAAYEIDEADVAAAKLAWWAQELEVAVTGHARHPITHALFDDVVRAADRSLWPALAVGAFKQVEGRTGGTLGDLIEQREPFHLAIADAESALFLGDAANIDANAALWSLSSLLGALRGAPDERMPMPLDLLARHGLTRADLAVPGKARDALVRDYLAALQFEFKGAQGVASARTLGQRVRVRTDLALIERALRAANPLEVAASWRIGQLRALYFAWSEARAQTRGR